MKRGFLLVLATFLILVPCSFATEVCGNVSGTWTLEGSPYYVMCHITLPSGQILTIEPGVQVLFTGHYKFNVHGNLQAIGTEEDSIIFSRAFDTEESKWWGIRTYSGSSSTHLAYCVIEYGRATGNSYDESGGGMMCLSSSPTIDHCTIQHNYAEYGGGGVYSDAGAPHFTNCVISKNEGFHSGGVNCWHSAAVFVNCTISHNHGTTFGGNVRVAQSTSLFRNCIFSSGDGPGVMFAPGFQPFGSFDHCDAYGNEGGDFEGQVPAGIGNFDNTNANGDPCDNYFNIQMDPLYVNAGGEDYHLTAESPCIDAGNPIVGNDPDGTLPDIGAFSFDHVFYGFTGFITLTDVRPTQRRFQLTHVEGPITQISFTGFCDGTTGRVTGRANRNWDVLPNGDGNDGDSIIFVALSPLTQGSIETFELRHRNCQSNLAWCVGDTCGVIPQTIAGGGLASHLGQNHPNPFNPVTKIAFELAETGHTQLTVFDLLGREVTSLINETLTAGHHEVTFDATLLPSGIYIYRLETTAFRAERKMLLVR